mmetsp:Transcript_85826/g.247671  ORF Transcript_85826/g.247671 Transcript_85826/m.247671 type:complete len:483 (-) Transcript_85826:281-1729(-)
MWFGGELLSLGAIFVDVWASAFTHLHPFYYAFVPYWTLILGALCLSPLTVLLPQLIKGELSWPSKEDVRNEWIIHGKTYDLTPFYDSHPGGSWALRAAKGSECTGLFESYHLFIDREVLLKMLDRYEIDTGDRKAPELSMVFHDDFYADLKASVREYFNGKGKGAHKMTWPYLTYNLVAWATMWSMIYGILFKDALWCIPFVGYLSCYLTGSIMHDASHNALVSSPTWNRILSHAAFPYGINVTAWQIQHIMSHHIYTNGEEDVDLFHFDPIVTLKKGEGHVNIVLHVIRLLLVLSTAVVHLAIAVPYGLLFGQIDPVPGHRMYDRVKAINAHRAELRREMMIELAALFAYFAVCWYQQGLIKGICVQMSIFTISSYIFSFFTQVSHLQEECFGEGDDLKKLSFAKRQVATSMDFATDSFFWSLASGGLNTQSIHHCFPSVSATQLRDLYPTFRRVCRKHGVELKEARSMMDFIWGFVQFAN